MNSQSTCKQWLFLGTLVLLASCGGGSTGTGSSSATSGNATTNVAVGTVNGFGSVIIDGVRFDDSAAKIELENEPGVPVAIRTSDLQLGQTATVVFSGNESNALAQSIRIEGEIVGTVDSVDVGAGKLIVSGQDVRTNADATKGPVTVFDGFLALADVKVGDRIEVHGTPQVDGTAALFIQATRIERKTAAVPFVRITGTIEELTLNTFKLGGMTVSFATTTRIIPVGTTLSNGQRVAVWSDSPAAAGTLTAKAIRVKNALAAAGSVRIAGPITDCAVPCPASFKVNGMPIDAAAAKFDNGSAAALLNGVSVRIRGVLDATTGKVLASSVEFRRQDELELDVRGTILGFTPGATGTATFTVRGVPIQINAQTKRSDCQGELADGIAIKVEGKVAGNMMLATELKCLASLNALKVEIRGLISVVDPVGTSPPTTFQLDSQPGLVIGYSAATTKFENGDASKLVVGAHVELEGTVIDGKLTATEIEFKRAPGVRERTVKGKVFAITATTFKVGSLMIAVGSAAIPVGFVDGVRVEVNFTTTNGAHSATDIRLYSETGASPIRSDLPALIWHSVTLSARANVFLLPDIPYLCADGTVSTGEACPQSPGNYFTYGEMPAPSWNSATLEAWANVVPLTVIPYLCADGTVSTGEACSQSPWNSFTYGN